MFYVHWTLSVFVASLCHANDHEVNFDAWFNQLNDDLRAIYQYTAHFAWELRYKIQIVLPTIFRIENFIFGCFRRLILLV